VVLPGLSQWTVKSCAVWLAVAATALLHLGGCGSKKASDRAQTAGLEKAFPDLAAVAPAQTDQTVPIGDLRAYVSVALRAVRSNDLATGVIMLKKAMRVPGMTVDQIQASQEARKAWMTDLKERVARGEESAKAELAAIEQAQWQ
jgi:hypothetical protein